MSFYINEKERKMRRQLAMRVQSQNTNIAFDDNLTFGQKVAEQIARFGGSWTFIFCFLGVLILWMIINSLILIRWGTPFDPYPFILLNLVLSCLAAIQAPLILMSQNRQAARDRFDAEQDYKVNLKSELEIRELHRKMDVLLRQLNGLHKTVGQLDRQKGEDHA